MQHKRVLLIMGSRYIDRIHRGIANYAGKNYWRLTNLFGENPDLIHRRDCDGIIAIISPNDPLSNAVIGLKKPTVDLSIFSQDLPMPHITGNNDAMGREAAKHFISRGFKRFLWFSGKNHTVARQRENGYRSELNTNGFDLTSLIVERQFPYQKPNWKELTNWIQDSVRKVGFPCAVYANKDTQAIDVIDACISGDILIPNEVAVLGTDNHPLVCPTAAIPLSSINHDLEELGHRAAQELDKLMKGAPSERKIIEIPHKGISVRQSSDVFAINDMNVANALRYIYDNFHRSISIDEIVAATSCNRRMLERKFREHLDHSILTQLNQRRIEQANRLLRESDLAIADIAARSGFRTPEYFHRVFLNKTGLTPKKFRYETKTT